VNAECKSAAGWEPSLLATVLLLLAFGVLVFAWGSAAIMLGGRALSGLLGAPTSSPPPGG
jgi:hypothetical protein